MSVRQSVEMERSEERRPVMMEIQTMKMDAAALVS
jgi:hypothetical protein